MKNNIIRLVTYISFLFSAGMQLAYADEPNGPSLGQMADSALGPLGVMINLMYKVCYIIGAGLIVSGAVQYKAYRDNPSQVPLSRPILLVVFGLILIALPFVTRLSIGSTAAVTS